MFSCVSTFASSALGAMRVARRCTDVVLDDAEDVGSTLVVVVVGRVVVVVVVVVVAVVAAPMDEDVRRNMARYENRE